MYVYQITNKVNNKKYIGITNNPKKRWENHKCNSDPTMVIAKAIQKYGKNNFEFTILLSGLSIEEASNKEVELIYKLNTRVPNGYNVAEGGQYNINHKIHNGADNGRALLTEEEAQYIKDHRNLPMYVLYEEFADKISYETFKKCYKHQTYKNLTPSVEEYPNNIQYSAQFANGKLEYDEIVDIRTRYNNGEHWKNVYQDYSDKYAETSFWRLYTGLTYKLVMPEVFTEENKKKHSKKSVGIKNPHSILTEEQVLDIRKKHNEGISNSELYKLYPQISRTSIRDIINKKTWKHLL